MCLLSRLRELHLVSLDFGATVPESFDALIYPVDIVFDEGNNVYKLRTKPEEIYKAWNGNQ